MSKTEFFKCGAERRQDSLTRLSATSYLLIFGYGEDDGLGYNWRKYYDHLPTPSELRADIEGLINGITDYTILTGMVWNGKPVYLSAENQMNFKATHDLAQQTNGAVLPVKFKLGEDKDGKPVYHTFTKIEPMTDFIIKCFTHINTATNEGWVEKDAVDYDKLLTIEEI